MQSPEFSGILHESTLEQQIRLHIFFKLSKLAFMDLLLIFLLLCMSAFFSGSESAMFSIRWWRINYLKHNAGSTGKVLADLMERPKGVLIAILLGNTLVNVAAS